MVWVGLGWVGWRAGSGRSSEGCRWFVIQYKKEQRFV